MSEKKHPLYIVVASYNSDEAPEYDGATVKGVFADMERAKAALASHAAEFAEWANIPEEEWKPGYQSDPESVKYSENYWSEDGMKARCRHGTSAWDRVEVVVADPARVSFPCEW